GAAAGEIREKGPARVQSRRRQTAVPGPLHRPAFRDGVGHRPAPEEGDGADCSPSRGSSPAPLRTPARPTQPLEPILIPKPAADMVRPGARFTPSPPDFQGPARAHRTPPEPRRFPGHGPLSRGEPIPGRPALHKERELSPGLPPASPGPARGSSRTERPPLARELNPPGGLRGPHPFTS
uniref:Uncharacterized protein n=1 Tax=Amphiprion percula TaxID=161767 RepID=A0A3P8S1Z8_AMPPE